MESKIAQSRLETRHLMILLLVLLALGLFANTRPAVAGGPTTLPIRTSNTDLAIWLGTFGNDGINGGPTLEIAHAAKVNGAWMRDPADIGIAYYRGIIDLDPAFVNPGMYGNIYMGVNNPLHTESWRGEIYHFDGNTIRLRQETNGNHPDENNLTTDAYD